MPHVDTSTFVHGRSVEGGRERGECDVLSPLQSGDGEMEPLEASLSSASKSCSPDPQFEMGEEEQEGSNAPPVEIGGEVVSPARFTFSAPMDNIVVRSYQFSIA